jgi:Protein of unknown function (DUF1579)
MKHFLILAVVVSAVAVPPATHSQEEKAPPKAEGFQALDHFVGAWKTEVTDKPAKWLPQGGKRDVQESLSWILKDRFILGREVSRPDGVRSLWLMTYDPKAKTYPLWYFNTSGVFGGEWGSTWDSATKTLTGKATDTPNGWTSRGTNHFPDKNTDQVAVWMKDETGTLLFDSETIKTRQPAEVGVKTLAEWSKQKNPDEKLPPELKVLERFVGSWDTVAISKPAVWTPKEVRTTSKVTRKWVLDGQFLQDTSEISDGQEGFSLTTFDPQMKKYRGWWFNSEGHRNKSFGEWDGATETLSFKADLDDGLVARSSVRFIDKNRHVWKVEIKDRDGKLYFDCEWTVTRRK